MATTPTKQQAADKKAAAAEPTKAQQQAKARESGAKPDYPDQYPMAGMTIKNEGKANTRLFQTSPDVKEYLTKEEAENPPLDKDGNPTRPKFYWADTPEEVERNVKGRI